MSPAGHAQEARPAGASRLVFRHSAVVRITHWINAFCLALLLLSGLQIFNAYPRLHWGSSGADADPAFIAIEAVEEDGERRGITRIGPFTFDTTGVLGLSRQRGELRERAFPAWATIPSYRDLASGRRWHFFFAWLFVLNGLIYLLYGFAAGHFRRDILPDRDQLSLSQIGRELANHARLRFPKGEEALRYNSFQKIAYFTVIFVLLPLMLATGLTMSPAMDAAFPWLLDLFGGRQSARTLHFISATLLVLFFLVHIVMVLVSGVWNNIRSMMTGRYAIDRRESGS